MGTTRRRRNIGDKKCFFCDPGTGRGMILRSGLRAGSSVPVIQDLDLSQNKLTAEQFEAPDAKLR